MVAEPIKIDPAAVYSKAAIAEVFSVSTRCVEKWIKRRRLPKPFYQGRQPMWTGAAIMRYMDRKQAEAAA